MTTKKEKRRRRFEEFVEEVKIREGHSGALVLARRDETSTWVPMAVGDVPDILAPSIMLSALGQVVIVTVGSAKMIVDDEIVENDDPRRVTVLVWIESGVFFVGVRFDDEGTFEVFDDEDLDPSSTNGDGDLEVSGGRSSGIGGAITDALLEVSQGHREFIEILSDAYSIRQKG